MHEAPVRVYLGLVERPDPAGCVVEGLPQLRWYDVQRRQHFPGRHAWRDQLHTVEAARELAQRGISALLDGGEDLAHRGHRALAGQLRRREEMAKVPRDAAEVEAREQL